MPPWRTTLEMREGSMPDSRATMARASSEVWRCCSSKSAGTYSASITGVIGSTLSRRTTPLPVCDSVAAVAIAGLARSVSARSMGTRMDLNICASKSSSQDVLPARRAINPIETALTSKQPRTDEQHQLAAAVSHVTPILDVKVEDRKPRRGQVVGERLCGGGIAAARQHQGDLVHARIVADQQQLPRISRNGCSANGFQDLGGIGGVEFRQDVDLRRCHAVFHGLPGNVPGLPGPDGMRYQYGVGKRGMGGDPVADLGAILVAAVLDPAVLVTAARRVGLGLGVTQQHQTAHGTLESLRVRNNLQVPVEGKVTGAGTV